jgi:hypothetical protein
MARALAKVRAQKARLAAKVAHVPLARVRVRPLAKVRK